MYLNIFQIIFGTGDQLKCVTVSANSGFVRAAEHQVKNMCKGRQLKRIFNKKKLYVCIV